MCKIVSSTIFVLLNNMHERNSMQVNRSNIQAAQFKYNCSLECYDNYTHILYMYYILGPVITIDILQKTLTRPDTAALVNMLGGKGELSVPLGGNSLNPPQLIVVNKGGHNGVNISIQQTPQQAFQTGIDQKVLLIPIKKYC